MPQKEIKCKWLWGGVASQSRQGPAGTIPPNFRKRYTNEVEAADEPGKWSPHKFKARKDGRLSCYWLRRISATWTDDPEALRTIVCRSTMQWTADQVPRTTESTCQKQPLACGQIRFHETPTAEWHGCHKAKPLARLRRNPPQIQSARPGPNKKPSTSTMVLIPLVQKSTIIFTFHLLTACLRCLLDQTPSIPLPYKAKGRGELSASMLIPPQGLFNLWHRASPYGHGTWKSPKIMQQPSAFFSPPTNHISQPANISSPCQPVSQFLPLLIDQVDYTKYSGRDRCYTGQ